MSVDYKEKDIQYRLYKNFEKLPNLLWIEKLKKLHHLDREDLLFRPIKYLLNKKYQHIFKKMWGISDFVYKFWSVKKWSDGQPFLSEYNVSEQDNRRNARIDLLSYTIDPSTFFVSEVKWNIDTERETITELLQYSNWLQINDFPSLANDDIVFLVVARKRSNILIHSVVNGILFKWLNILPLQVKIKPRNKLSIELFDLWNTNILGNLNNQIYSERNYSSRILAFDEFQPATWNGVLWVDAEDMKILVARTAIDLTQNGFCGYVLGMVKEDQLLYKNLIALLYFDPFSLETKKWDVFSKKKVKELLKFSAEEPNYYFDTSILRENIKFHFPERNIDFEEGGGGLYSQISSRYLFSFWYPIWFIEILIKDLIGYCREDKQFSCSIGIGEDVNSNLEMYYWTYLNCLFQVHNTKTDSLVNLYEYLRNSECC